MRKGQKIDPIELRKLLKKPYIRKIDIANHFDTTKQNLNAYFVRHNIVMSSRIV